MDADKTSDAARKRSFSASLRGYDRDEVDRFRDEMATHIAHLEAKLETAEHKLTQLGLAEVPDLSRELATVGADISAILDEARRTATEMRERAAADVESWRSAAQTDVGTMRAEAQAAAEELRGHAWREGTDLLDLAKEEAERIVAAGRQDVLFIRAEAEREVLRLTGEARREAEELLRNSRAEADRLTAEADAEAAEIVNTAERSVEGAIERAHVLEARRSELLSEIDSARLTLDAMQTGGVEAQRIVRPGQETPEMTWHDDEDASVKIVPSSQRPLTGPVDADEMVAEVEQMRSERSQAATPDPVPDETLPDIGATAAEESAAKGDTSSADARQFDEVVPHVAAVPDVPVVSIVPPLEIDPGADEFPEPSLPVDTESVPGPEETVTPDVPLATIPSEPPAESAAEVVATEPSAEPIAGLFAQLRLPTEPAAEPSAPEVPAAESAAPRAADAAPASAKASTTPAPFGSAPSESPTGEGAFELRDRLLLPIENKALRAVKRHLVDLQNRVLEELRTATGTWSPDPDEFLAEMSDDIMTMRLEAHAAGGVAAAELTGRGHLEIAVRTGNPATREFAESLIAAVGAAHQHAVDDQAGSRELASAVSRVFRAWRTDEAERRLRSAAYRAYHDGLIDGFATAGVAAVTAVTFGRPCAECPSGAEWAPGAPLPKGLQMPPAHVECSTTIVPAGMAG